MKRIEIGVGGSFKEMVAEVIDVWHRAEAGESLPEATPRIDFATLGELYSTLTEKRLELVRYIASHEGLNTHQLAKALGRDYKNVHTDVNALTALELLAKDSRGRLSAPFDEIVIRAGIRRVA